MIIGIDAGSLSVSDIRLRVGVWHVTYELLKRISIVDTKNYYRLYSFTAIDRSLMAQFGKRMTNVLLAPSIGYMKFRLPLELRLHPVDMFIGLSQALPSCVQTKLIGCIYDVGFLHMGKSYGSSYDKLKKQTQDVVKRADRIVTISEFSKKDIMKSYGVKEENITVIYPGVSILPFPVLKKSRCPYILFVGALKRAKNIPAAIDGFRTFLKRVKKDYDFYLIGGDYWMDPDIQKTIRKYALEKRVHISGHVSESDLSSYYSGASAFITLGKWEGFCIPAVEAMGYGIPVIYANSGALPEIVGTAGVAVDPTDVTAVGKAIKKSIENAKFRLSCIRKGYERALDFSWKRFGNQWLDLIQKLEVSS